MIEWGLSMMAESSRPEPRCWCYDVDAGREAASQQATPPAASSTEPHASDEGWMRRALFLAATAREAGEVPVGAVLVKNGELVAEGWNRPISTNDPTAHAEVIALRAGGSRIGNYRLVDTTLYVTLEPCVMCLGAILHARVKRLVFGASDSKLGATGRILQLTASEFLNHRFEVTGGVLVRECSSLLKNFFRERR